MESNRIVSPEEWVTERIALLQKEKELTRLRDRLAARRRALPWVRVSKRYEFDGPEGHDVSYAVVARAPIGEIEAVRQRMGWRFRWVSSFASDFNYDFHVSFRPGDIAAGTARYSYRDAQPGLEDFSGDSVFFRNEAGEIFHTYSTYSRGGEEFLGIYRYLEVMPKGRNENGPHHSLVDWARPRNLYGKGGTVEGNGRYHAEGCPCAATS